MDHMTNTSQPGRHAQAGDAPVADRWLLRVRGAVDVEIEDERGNRIGRYIPGGEVKEEEREEPGEEKEGRERPSHPAQANQDLPNLWEITIPGATYHPGRTVTSVFLGQPGRYTCKFRGRSASAADIYFTSFSSQAKLRTIFFQSIPIREREQAQFVYDTFAPPAAPVLTLGTREIEPTAILSPSESDDTTPPATSISIQDGQMMLSATDNPGGAGVWRSYYTTDGRNFAVYTQPLPLPPDAKIVMGYSVDRNGNREYPGAVLPVLQISQSHIVFTAIAGNTKIAAQRVRVMNPDPIPLTGQLQWRASTETPWLAVEPQEGMTPGLITLSVNIGTLGPGTYTGSVIVSSPTPNVVYAERVISVDLVVSAGQGQLSSQ